MLYARPGRARAGHRYIPSQGLLRTCSVRLVDIWLALALPKRLDLGTSRPGRVKGRPQLGRPGIARRSAWPLPGRPSFGSSGRQNRSCAMCNLLTRYTLVCNLMGCYQLTEPRLELTAYTESTPPLKEQLSFSPTRNNFRSTTWSTSWPRWSRPIVRYGSSSTGSSPVLAFELTGSKRSTDD